MKVELSCDALGEVVVHELRYWVNYLSNEINGPYEDDNERNKQIIKACRTLLKFYEADEE